MITHGNDFDRDQSADQCENDQYIACRLTFIHVNIPGC